LLLLLLFFLTQKEQRERMMNKKVLAVTMLYPLLTKEKEFSHRRSSAREG